MNLVIDRGNTQVKFGVFDQWHLVHSDSTVFLDKSLLKELTELYSVKQIIVSSVVKERHDELIANLKEVSKRVIELDHQTPMPFKWHYETKESMGKDRLAAVAGGMSLFPDSPLLVIDAGTAITYEVVNDKKEYMGGNIAPGMQMRFKALHQFTSCLPLCEPSSEVALFGDSTQSAIQAGVQTGMTLEIEGLVTKLEKLYSGLKTLITGGDAEFFARKLKNPIFVQPNLVLIGLNRILEYNAQHI